MGFVRQEQSLADGVIQARLAPSVLVEEHVREQAVALDELPRVGVGLVPPALGDGGLEVLIHAGEEGDISDEALALFETRLAEIQNGEFEVPFIPEA